MKNIARILNAEINRQMNTISLIASENIASKAVREAASSVLTNKYAEGYPAKRYYAGCEYADEIETLAIDLAKKIFHCNWANVQPHSGSQANSAVYLALLNPGDTILSLSLEAGGHLTHGAKVSNISKFYNIVHYQVDKNGVIDMKNVAQLAHEYKPKLIITGASSYPRLFNWKKFREIANEVGAYLMADIAHTAGLVAGLVHENPIEYVDVVTSTTHKTLRGPRGGIILSNNIELGAKIDRAVFPGIQGGPFMNIIAAKAVSFAEILANDRKDFCLYSQKVIFNAQILAEKLMVAGGRLITNGTDNHLMILDCASFGMDGNAMQNLLLDANILISVSALPGQSWLVPGAIRIGTPYLTSLGIENIEEFANLFINCLQTKNPHALKEYVIAQANRLYPRFL